MKPDETKADGNVQVGRKSNVRQLVLLGIFLVVLGAFLVDRFYLMPSAEKKITQAVEDVCRSTHEGNQQQIHELFGFKPSRVYDFQGYQVEQYRFPRGLPFYHRPVFDIAFKDGAIAFFSQEPMDEDSDILKEKLPRISRKRFASEDRENINLKMEASGGGG